MTYDPNEFEVRMSEYDGSEHIPCLGCGAMIYFTPCPHCGWDDN